MQKDGCARGHVGVGRQIARQHAAERRLTGAGGRGQLHALAGGNGEGDVIENGTTVEGDGEVPAF